MLRAFIVVSGFCLVLGACTQKMVCPAYQSAFIYDQNELRKKFSYFNEDSTPKVYTASKNKYLIAEPTTLKKKTREIQTVQVKQMHPVVPDSLSDNKKDNFDESDFSLAEVDFDSVALARDSLAQAAADSSATDSVYVISKDREVRILRYNFPDSLKYDSSLGKYVPEKPYYYVEEIGFNAEQDTYMWYLRDWLVLPDVRLAQMQGGKEGEAKSVSKKQKKEGGFFKNLFKKKDKKKKGENLVEPDSVETPQEETIDFKDLDNPDTTATAAPQRQTENVSVPTKKQKKGFSLFKKKNSNKADKKKQDPAKKEDEDDGF